MISSVIIDDEKPARESLGMMLTRFFPQKVKVIGSAESLKEGVLMIYKQRPDLVFLDIEMPGENGFRIFDYFQQVNFSVIFTTAYSEYAIRAIKVAALDYILKPVSVEALKEAFDLYDKRQLSGIPEENIQKLVDSLDPAPRRVEKAALPVFNGFQMEKIHAILYCEADQNYCWVHTIDGGKLLVSKPLNVIEDMLPPSLFFRIHKSFLVNLDYIKTYSRNEGFHVILENGKRLDVAERRNNDFIKALTNR
jgi:two-component system LytT family response regulator